MPIITYEPMASIVPNAEMRKQYIDGVFKTYRVKPSSGYVLHDTNYDFYEEVPVLDEFGEPVYDEYGEPIITEAPRLGYRPTEGSVGYFYEFTPIEMLDEAGNTVTAYGERQFYCKLATEVPADQIFGVTTTPEIV